jgi:hypothetical protein
MKGVYEFKVYEFKVPAVKVKIYELKDIADRETVGC